MAINRNMITNESAQPIVNQKIEDTSTSSSIGSTEIQDIQVPVLKGMNPILKYSLMGIGGALVIYIGYRFLFKK